MSRFLYVILLIVLFATFLLSLIYGRIDLLLISFIGSLLMKKTSEKYDLEKIKKAETEEIKKHYNYQES